MYITITIEKKKKKKKVGGGGGGGEGEGKKSHSMIRSRAMYTSVSDIIGRVGGAHSGWICTPFCGREREATERETIG